MRFGRLPAWALDLSRRIREVASEQGLLPPQVRDRGGWRASLWG